MNPLLKQQSKCFKDARNSYNSYGDMDDDIEGDPNDLDPYDDDYDEEMDDEQFMKYQNYEDDDSADMYDHQVGSLHNASRNIDPRLL